MELSRWETRRLRGNLTAASCGEGGAELSSSPTEIFLFCFLGKGGIEMTPEFPPLEAPADPGMREGWAPSPLGWGMAGGKRRGKDKITQSGENVWPSLILEPKSEGRIGIVWNWGAGTGRSPLCLCVPQSNSHSQGDASDPDSAELSVMFPRLSLPPFPASRSGSPDFYSSCTFFTPQV